MRTLIITILLFLSVKAYTQCNVEYSKNGDEYTCSTDFEKIYRNDDLQNGLKVYQVSTSQSLGLNTTTFKLFLFGSSSLYKKLVIPRNVNLLFKIIVECF